MRRTVPLPEREAIRQQRFAKIWSEELDAVFAEVAGYYDRANVVASLGLWNHYFLRNFLRLIELRPHARALDVCAGTNAVGIALLRREPSLQVQAIDRSAAMQDVGRRRATARGLAIASAIGDVHRLPFPDAHFDLVTLQFASRHLRLREVLREIRRVLRPGGHFYHSDMLRPANPLVGRIYSGYLRACLHLTAGLFASGRAVRDCRSYFIDTLEQFYTAAELSQLLRDEGFDAVDEKSLLLGMVGFHRARKPAIAPPESSACFT